MMIFLKILGRTDYKMTTTKITWSNECVWKLVKQERKKAQREQINSLIILFNMLDEKTKFLPILEDKLRELINK